ncbi:MAG: POTRA domain-containing protein [Paracoccaceae bacterium]
MPLPWYRFDRTGALVLAALTLGLAATPPYALDRLDFTVQGGGDLEDRLRASSVLLSTKREKATDAQDYFAAAQAEYGRLLGALYASGHYSGVVTVRIDGREAAEIAPLDAPSAISSIAVTVQPGPRFDFGHAEAAPLAAGTEMPKGFATGLPAESGIIQDAASAAVDGWRDLGHAKATVSGQRIVADHARARLDAELTLTPGPRLRFGDLTIEGNQRVRTGRVREIAGLPTGEVFSPAALEKSAKRLRRAGAFRSVALTEADQPGVDASPTSPRRSSRKSAAGSALARNWPAPTG